MRPGVIPVATGGDSAGSIPAAFCGVTGLKGTYGRVPRPAGRLLAQLTVAGVIGAEPGRRFLRRPGLCPARRRSGRPGGRTASGAGSRRDDPREVAVRLANPAAGWLPLNALDRGEVADLSQVARGSLEGFEHRRTVGRAVSVRAGRRPAERQ